MGAGDMGSELEEITAGFSMLRHENLFIQLESISLIKTGLT